jgi:hypothetical protein
LLMDLEMWASFSPHHVTMCYILVWVFANPSWHP